MKQSVKFYVFIVSLFILVLPAPSLAQTYWLSHFHFLNKLPADVKHFKYELQPWTEQEKAIVIQQLSMIQQYGPGLMQRATAYGPIQIYRVADSTVRTQQIRIVALAHPRHRYMVFSDRYFDYYKKGSNARWFTFWATAHELTHIADLGDKISLSKRWNQLMGWRIKAYNKALKKGSINKKQKMQLIKKYGLITNYAAKDLNEALAEYTAAVLTDRIPAFNLRYVKVPADIQSFINKNLLAMPFNANQSDQLFLQAYKAFDKEKFHTGVNLLTRAIALDPHFITAYYSRAKAWMVLGNYTNAYTDLQKALALNPGTNFLTNRIYYSMALINYYQQRYPQTISHLNKALNVDTKDGFSYYYLAKVYRHTGKINLAIANFKHAVHYLPKYIPIRKHSFYYIALLNMDQKQYRQAINVLSEAIAEYPKYGEAYYLRGLNWYYLENDNKAMNEFRSALQFTADKNKVRPLIYYYIGKIYQARQQYRRAIESYQKTIKLNPRIGIAYFQLGNIYYLHKKKYQQAILAYQRAIQHLPKRSYYRQNAFLQIGLIYFVAENYSSAITAFNKTIQEYPSFALVYIYRGLAYSTTGKYALAVKDFQRAFVLNPKLKVKYGHYLQKAQEKAG